MDNCGNSRANTCAKAAQAVHLLDQDQGGSNVSIGGDSE